MKACGRSYVFEAVYFMLDPDYNVYMDTHQAVNRGIIRAFLRLRVEFAYPTHTLIVRAEAQDAPEAPGHEAARVAH